MQLTDIHPPQEEVIRTHADAIKELGDYLVAYQDPLETNRQTDRKEDTADHDPIAALGVWERESTYNLEEVYSATGPAPLAQQWFVRATSVESIESGQRPF